MATTDGINAVCNGIIHILRTSMAAQITELGLGAINPRFEIYKPEDFSDSQSVRRVTSGASLFLYRALPNLFHRTPSGNTLSGGQKQYSKLPLDLYLLLTIWGEDPSTQNRLVGWVLRTLEDYQQIPASVLNIGTSSPIFAENESVELLLSEMNGDELLQVWDILGGDGELPYQITIPYLVRNLLLDSQRVLPVGEPVQVRTADLQRLTEAR